LTAHTLATHALLVKEATQFFQTVASDGSLIGGNRVIAMMAVTTRGTIHTISQVNQFMGYCYLNRLWLHVWLDKDEMAVTG
jgi:hypothetical protein